MVNWRPRLCIHRTGTSALTFNAMMVQISYCLSTEMSSFIGPGLKIGHKNRDICSLQSFLSFAYCWKIKKMKKRDLEEKEARPVTVLENQVALQKL